jgi:phosphatidylserine/phosphatidylglycerophosphate/cardiolipin synthase-like enzyme
MFEGASGYRKGSDALLEAGVELYESKPRMAAQTELMNGPLLERFNSKMALHAKSMVVDGKISVVGSFNLDPRSANLNTESITVIHSKDVAAHLLERMETEMAPENAWQHTQDFTPDKKHRFFGAFKSSWPKLYPCLCCKTVVWCLVHGGLVCPVALNCV